MTYESHQMEAPQAISDRLSRIEAKADNMAGDIREIKAELHAATESAFPRREADLRSGEIDRRMLELTQAIGTRLETQTYSVAHDALIQRVVRLETNPQRQLGWIALSVSAAGCLVTFLGVMVALLTGLGVILVNVVKP